MQLTTADGLDLNLVNPAYRESIQDCRAAHQRALAVLERAKRAERAAGDHLAYWHHLNMRARWTRWEYTLAGHRYDRTLDALDDAQRAEHMTREILEEHVAEALAHAATEQFRLA